MKVRKRARAEPMKSVRHGRRRESKAAWVESYHANPLNSMTGLQVICFHRYEKNFLQGRTRGLKDAERIECVERAKAMSDLINRFRKNRRTHEACHA